MTAYLYTWSPGERQWLFRGDYSTAEMAKEQGRLLWRAGARGVKVTEIVTVVEETR